MSVTFLYHLADEDLCNACDDLCDWLGNLLAEALLNYLLMVRMELLNTEVGYSMFVELRTFRMACLGNAWRRYASNRSYCEGLRLFIRTLIQITMLMYTWTTKNEYKPEIVL